MIVIISEGGLNGFIDCITFDLAVFQLIHVVHLGADSDLCAI